MDGTALEVHPSLGDDTDLIDTIELTSAAGS